MARRFRPSDQLLPFGPSPRLRSRPRRRKYAQLQQRLRLGRVRSYNALRGYFPLFDHRAAALASQFLRHGEARGMYSSSLRSLRRFYWWSRGRRTLRWLIPLRQSHQKTEFLVKALGALFAEEQRAAGRRAFLARRAAEVRRRAATDASDASNASGRRPRQRNLRRENRLGPKPSVKPRRKKRFQSFIPPVDFLSPDLREQPPASAEKKAARHLRRRLRWLRRRHRRYLRRLFFRRRRQLAHPEGSSAPSSLAGRRSRGIRRRWHALDATLGRRFRRPLVHRRRRLAAGQLGDFSPGAQPLGMRMVEFTEEALAHHLRRLRRRSKRYLRTSAKPSPAKVISPGATTLASATLTPPSRRLRRRLLPALRRILRRRRWLGVKNSLRFRRRLLRRRLRRRLASLRRLLRRILRRRRLRSRRMLQAYGLLRWRRRLGRRRQLLLRRNRRPAPATAPAKVAAVSAPAPKAKAQTTKGGRSEKKTSPVRLQGWRRERRQRLPLPLLRSPAPGVLGLWKRQRSLAPLTPGSSGRLVNLRRKFFLRFSAAALSGEKNRRRFAGDRRQLRGDTAPERHRRWPFPLRRRGLRRRRPQPSRDLSPARRRPELPSPLRRGRFTLRRRTAPAGQPSPPSKPRRKGSTKAKGLRALPAKKPSPPTPAAPTPVTPTPVAPALSAQELRREHNRRGFQKRQEQKLRRSGASPAAVAPPRPSPPPAKKRVRLSPEERQLRRRARRTPLAPLRTLGRYHRPWRVAYRITSLRITDPETLEEHSQLLLEKNYRRSSYGQFYGDLLRCLRPAQRVVFLVLGHKSSRRLEQRVKFGADEPARERVVLGFLRDQVSRNPVYNYLRRNVEVKPWPKAKKVLREVPRRSRRLTTSFTVRFGEQLGQLLTQSGALRRSLDDYDRHISAEGFRRRLRHYRWLPLRGGLGAALRQNRGLSQPR